MNKLIPGLSLQIGNIFCIGRNYADHAKELGNEVPKEPLVFLKPTSSICFSGDLLILPPQSKRVDHELEVVVAIGRVAKNITSREAHSFIAGIGVGIDLTARDLQAEAKKTGDPWAVAKGFDTFAPISEFVSPPSDPKRLLSLHFELQVNSETRQRGNTSEMIFSISELISYLSSIFTLSPGDLIFTGTPAGVSPLHSGDRVVATLENWTQLTVEVR